MRAREEGLLRLAWRRRESLGTMSDQAFEELRLAVAANPDAFVDDASDAAYLQLARALEADEAGRVEEEFLDDDEYQASHAARMERLAAACQRICDETGDCLDARTIAAMVTGVEAGDVLEELLALDAEQPDMACEGAADGANPWDNPFMRPRLRLRAAIARMMLETTRFKATCELCGQLVELMPGDPLGLRYTWSLACARLEDETAFNELDARFDRQGNAWSHLARVLLMFKLDRMPAARRALRGFTSLCEGGAYALLRPTYVDTYLPDRPSFRPGSYEEAMLAVHEADPVVVDTPDFIPWATAQKGIAEEARRYAEDNDLDW